MAEHSEDLIYLAGFIDADGCVTINRSRRGDRVYYGAVVGISGTRRTPHDLAASIWGGKVWCWQPANPLHRPNFQWARQGLSAVKALRDLQPYLRLKAEQTALAIMLHADPSMALSAKDAIAEKVFALNQDRRR